MGDGVVCSVAASAFHVDRLAIVGDLKTRRFVADADLNSPVVVTTISRRVFDTGDLRGGRDVVRRILEDRDVTEVLVRLEVLPRQIRSHPFSRAPGAALFDSLLDDFIDLVVVTTRNNT